MIPYLISILGPLLVALKVIVGTALVYYGIGAKKSFPVVFGLAILLIAVSYFVDVKWIAGHEADIVLSLLSSSMFGFAIMLLTRVPGTSPIFNGAIGLATLGGFYAIMNGVHNSTDLYQIFDAATSALVVFSLGFIVAIQSSGERPILASSVAVMTLAYTALNAEYFHLENLLPHYNEILAAATVAYAALIGAAYVLPRLDDTPPSSFTPRNVFKEIRRSVGTAFTQSSFSARTGV